MRPPAVLLAMLLVLGGCRTHGTTATPEGTWEAPPEDDAGSWLRRGHFSHGDLEGLRVYLRIHDGGELQLRDSADWVSLSLNECAETLSILARMYAWRTRPSGKSEWREEGASGSEGTGLSLTLEADPEVPWRHIQWILTIAAEQRYEKFELACGPRRLLAHLPFDDSTEWIDDDSATHVSLRVDVVATSWRMMPWDGAMLQRPAGTAYRMAAGRYRVFRLESALIAGIESPDPAAAQRWIARGRKAASPEDRVVGAIRADGQVSFAKVFDVMEAFVSAGVPDVGFDAGCAIPWPRERESRRLPFPGGNQADASPSSDAR